MLEKMFISKATTKVKLVKKVSGVNPTVNPRPMCYKKTTISCT